MVVQILLSRTSQLSPRSSTHLSPNLNSHIYEHVGMQSVLEAQHGTNRMQGSAALEPSEQAAQAARGIAAVAPETFLAEPAYTLPSTLLSLPKPPLTPSVGDILQKTRPLF